MTPSTPSLADFLEAANAVYLRTVPDGLIPLLNSAGKPVASDPSTNDDGFYAQAFTDSAGHVIIAFEGTQAPTSGSNYGLGTVGADTLLFLGDIPNALRDAKSFASDVISIATAQGYSTDQIFVTGHSLGGAEAEAASVNIPRFANLTLGGITFGAPGISGAAPNGKLVDYVDFGDAVGNFDAKLNIGASYTPQSVTHVGKVEMVGSATNAEPLLRETEAYHIITSIEKNPFFFAMLRGANVAVNAFLVADLVAVAETQIPFHSLTSNYAPDLGLNIASDGTVFANGTVGPIAHPTFGIDQLPSIPLAFASDVFSTGGQLQQLSFTGTDGTSNLALFGANGSLLVDNGYNAAGQLTNTILVNNDNSEIDTFFNVDGGPLRDEQFTVGSTGQFRSVTANFVDGTFLTFDQNTYANPNYNSATGVLEAGLLDAAGMSIATLAIDTTSGIDTLTLSDGYQIQIAEGSAHLAAPTAGASAEQTLLGYLADLGVAMNAAQLDAAHDVFLAEAGKPATHTFTFGNGHTITLDRGSYGFANLNSFSAGTFNATLATADGEIIGALVLDANGAGTLELLPSGLRIAISASSAAHLTVPYAGGTPLQTLSGYLTELGAPMSVAQLSEVEFNHLHPTGTAYDVTGGPVKVDDTHANVFYSVFGAPGAVAAGQPTAVITDYTPGVNAFGNPIQIPYLFNATAYNILRAAGDISQDTITDIQELDTGGVALTNAQLYQFDNINGNGTIAAVDGGTFDLSAANIDPGASFSLSASAWSGTILIGNDTAGQTLTASLFGDDTLRAGNGTGDVLVAGLGVDTLIGGTGGDTFMAYWGVFAAGSAIVGNGSANVLQSYGDISRLSISGVQTLMADSVTLTADQLSGFSSVEWLKPDLGGGRITASGGGTFSIAGKGPDHYDMTATDWSSTTLIGNDADGETLTASLFGDDTLRAGNGAGDRLFAGEGVDTLIGGTGGDIFIAVDGLAVGSAITGHGGANFLEAGGDISLATISGVQNLVTGVTAIDNNGFILPRDCTLTAAQFSGFTSITGGGIIQAATGGIYNLSGKTADTYDLIALSDDGTTLIGNSAAGEQLTASEGGDDMLVVGDSNGNSLIADDSFGNNRLTAGNGTSEVLRAADSFGDNILIVGSGAADRLDVSGSSGNNKLTAHDTSSTIGFSPLPGVISRGSAVVLVAEDSLGDNILISGDASGDVLSVDGSLGDNILIVGNGSFDNLSARNSLGDNRLTASNGNNVVLDVSNSAGDNILTVGNGNNVTLNAVGSTGNNTLIAGNGTATLIGGDGDDTLKAGRGDDTLVGGNGNNIYDFSNASITGNYIIDDFHTDDGSSIIVMGPNVTQSQVIASQSGQNLVLTIDDDPITVLNYYGGATHQISGIQFVDGTFWTPPPVDNTAPVAGDLSFVKDTPATALSVDNVVMFTLATSKNVWVSGAPELQLSDGEFAHYISGSGSLALNFIYEVASGDSTADLRVFGAGLYGGLLLNGGTIFDSSGNALTGNVHADTHLVIDTAAPQLMGISASPDSGGVSTGSTVQLTLDFNEAVRIVTGGTPQLSLNDGGTAVYDPAATALLGDSSKLVFGHLVSADNSAHSLAVTGFVANGAIVDDLAGNPANLSHVNAAFDALSINDNVASNKVAPAYTIGGITRPALEFDAAGHIILTPAASAAAEAYGLAFLYAGLPAGTPYPPVADPHTPSAISDGFHLV